MRPVLAFGEILIDFTPTKEQETYQANPGGAPANLLAALAKWGIHTHFVGKVGKDSFGELLKNTLKDAGISSDLLIEDEKARTTLAFVHLASEGERSFTFYRDGGADTRIERSELPKQVFKDQGIFHFGSLGFTHEPARSTQLALLEEALEAGWTVTYDPNYRAPLWESEKEAVRWMKRGLDFANLVKVSEEELLLLTGIEDQKTAARSLIDAHDLSMLAVTHGAKGSYFYTPKIEGYVPGYQVKAIDTTGAGDSFFAGVLYALMKEDHLETFDDRILRRALCFGNAVGALVTTRYGALLSMPTLEQVRLLQEGEERS